MDTIIFDYHAPWYSHALAGAMMLLGVLMWFAGGRALRVAFALFGAGAGVILALLLPPDIAAGGMRVLAILGLGLFGALLGGAAFRFSVAFTLAGAFSLIIPLLLVAGMETYGSPVSHREADQPLTTEEMTIQGVDVISGAEAFADDQIAGHAAEREVNPTPEATTPETRAEVWVDRSVDFLFELAADLKETKWDLLPPRDKSLVVFAGLAGIVIGLAIGMGAQRFAAAMLASGVGGILFIPSAVWLLHASKGPTAWLPESEGLWVLAWIVLSAVGSLTQHYVIMPKLKKKSSGDQAQG